jgi:hypothetical protein
MTIDARDPAVLARYAELTAARRGRRDGIFKKLGVDTIRLETGQPYIKPLMAFFEARRRRLR